MRNSLHVFLKNKNTGEQSEIEVVLDAPAEEITLSHPVFIHLDAVVESMGFNNHWVSWC
jgi:hypothetical protein